MMMAECQCECDAWFVDTGPRAAQGW